MRKITMEFWMPEDEEVNDINVGKHFGMSIMRGGLQYNVEEPTIEYDEYIIVKDTDNNVVGKRKVHSKIHVENICGYVINNSLIYSYGHYEEMQEQAKNLEEI